MILTGDIIERGKSINGGWNLRQLNALGLDNFKTGWHKRIIGVEVDEKNVELFLALKDAHVKDHRKERNKHQFEPIVGNIIYADQYKHPNWQKMRLVVLKRDGFKCINCNQRHKTLHAHHLKYLKGKFIWDVPHWYIITLCEDCHSDEHNRDLRIK